MSITIFNRIVGVSFYARPNNNNILTVPIVDDDIRATMKSAVVELLYRSGHLTATTTNALQMALNEPTDEYIKYLLGNRTAYNYETIINTVVNKILDRDLEGFYYRLETE